jgi:TldD protein
MVGFGEPDRVEAAVLLAHEYSLAGASRQPVALAPIPVREVDAAAPSPDDPRAISLPEKRQHAESLAALIAAADRRLDGTRVLCRDEVVESWLLTSEGVWVHALREAVSVAFLAEALEGGNLERAAGSLLVPGGWSGLARAEALALTVAERALDRLHAPPVRPGRYPVVLDPLAAGILVHRAVAHIARPSLPGADPDVLPIGARIGPECLTVGDDPTAPGLGASFPVDDEGTLARRTTIIQNGVVVGHLHSRETAEASRQAPTGHARAGAVRAAPFPRASNSFLAQGHGTLEELLDGVTLGVYVAGASSGDADGDRVALRAASARMIRHGRLAEPVKGVEVAGDVLALLGRADAVAGDFVWDTSAGRCRDGAAGIVSLATGAPHLRLVDVPVGGALA